MPAAVRIGTRGSALALVQARWVATRLGPGAELVEIRTAGDRGERVGDKERWVSELEAALIDGRIDIAVHSAKDVPGRLAPGTQLVAICAREDPRDALVGAPSLDALPPGARVGTASVRRAAQLRALRADLRVTELRGNVDTRLRKLAAGEADALVLAAAGLHRLGRGGEVGCLLEEIVPAPGQGALAIQARAEVTVAAAVDDAETAACVTAERAFARGIGASCNTPVGARARWSGDALELSGWVGLPDGSEWIADTVRGPAAAVGGELAGRMTAAGARELLARAESVAA